MDLMGNKKANNPVSPLQLWKGSKNFSIIFCFI